MKVIIRVVERLVGNIFGRLLVLIVVTGQMVPAQPECLFDCVTSTWHTFDVTSTNKPLPDDQINTLWIDSEQILWVGTRKGLAHFDGFEWKLEVDSDLEGHSIRAVTRDTHGRIWIGTIDGLQIMVDEQLSEPFTTVNGLSDNWINVLAPEHAGGMWVGTLNGISHYDGTKFDDVIQTVSGIQVGNVKGIASIDDQQAYVAAGSNVFHVNRSGEHHLLMMPKFDNERVQALTLTGNGRLYAGTNRKLYLYDDGQFQPVSSTDQMMNIQTMIPNGDDGIWLGTTDGLWHMNGLAFDQHYTIENSELASNMVNTLVQDAQGTLWIGSTGGVNRWRPTAWQTFPGVGSNIKAIVGSGDHKWVMSDSGLWREDGQEWQHVMQDRGLGLWKNDNTLWVGMDDHLIQLDAETGVKTASIPLPGQPRVVYGTEDDTLWIGMDAGLEQWQGGKTIVHQLSEDSDFAYVKALTVTETAVWVGSNHGLHVFREGNWHTVTWGNEIETNSVRALAQGTDHSLWVGTDAGIRRLSSEASFAEAETWQHYAVSDGLGNPHVNTILADANGQMWFGHDRGLSGLDDNHTVEKGDDIWVNFSDGDGLPSSRITALWRDETGLLWVGTDTHLSRYEPIGVPPSLTVPGIRTQGKSIPFSDVLKWQQTDVDVIFNGAGINFTQYKYRYRLDSGEWFAINKSGVNLQLTPDTSYEIDLQAVDESLNESPIINRQFAVESLPILARTSVQISGVVGVVVLLGIVMVLGPGGRWWRSLRRVSYREIWHLAFHQITENVISVEAQQHVKRHPYLILEHQINRIFKPTKKYTHVQPIETILDDSHLAQLLPREFGQRISRIEEWPGYHMRLRFDFTDAPALAGHAWEEVEAVPGKPLGLSVKTAVSRTLSLPEQVNGLNDKEIDISLPPVSIHESLNILLIVASPEMPPAYEPLPKLDIQQEIRRIKKAIKDRPAIEYVLAGIGSGGNDTGVPQQEALPAELQNAEGKPPHVVHFIGHAGFDPAKPEDLVLYLEDEYGQYRPLGVSSFVKMIQESQSNHTGSRLIVLNACQTATVPGGDILAGLIPSLMLETGVKAVVGMQYPIGDEAASIFSTVFYKNLLQTQPVDYAVSQARMAIKRELDSPDWAAPVVYMKHDDGMIYEL